MDGPWVDRSFAQPNIAFRCRCGWDGIDADIEAWDVQFERDRAVRVCPDCDDPVPEWGTIASIDGATRIARGSLRDSLAEAGVVDDR